jgi:hypothetical protein
VTLSPAGSPTARSLEDAAQEVAPWIALLARIGYLAKALLYATVGILAAQAALGSGGRTTDLGGALRAVVRAPLGEAMLLVIAVGLAAYAVWRVVAAVTDAEGRGGDLKGIANRVGSAFRGLGHAVLALAAFRLAIGSGDGGGPRSERLAARALDLPGGEWLVWLAAGAMLGYGGYQLYRAYAAKLGRRLSLAALPAGSARWVTALCRSGIAARGIVFGLIGVLLVRAAARRDPEQAGGIRESLEMLAGMGRWPLAVVALGLVAYALYELLNARYRRIRVA